MRVQLGQAILFCPSPVAPRGNFAKHTRLCFHQDCVSAEVINSSGTVKASHDDSSID